MSEAPQPKEPVGMATGIVENVWKCASCGSVFRDQAGSHADRPKCPDCGASDTKLSEKKA